MNKQESDVEQETSGQEEVRDEGITSAAAEAFCFNCGRIVRRLIVHFDALSTDPVVGLEPLDNGPDG